MELSEKERKLQFAKIDLLLKNFDQASDKVKHSLIYEVGSAI